MPEALLPHLEIPPVDGDVHASIIWLHGLGATSDDFAPFFEDFALPGVRVLLPQAPTIPVTLNGGYRMPAWFDVDSLDRESKPDLHGLRDSARRISALISHEVARGVPSERIVVGGFSQGGAVSLFAGPRETRTLAGVVGLSTWLLAPALLKEEAHPTNAKTKIYMGHGTSDGIVRIEFGRASRDRLVALGYPVTFFESAVAHQVGPREAAALRTWLLEVLR